MNSGVLSGGRQNPPAKRFLDIHADLVPLGILDGGRRVTHPPAPPGGESKNVSPLTEKTVGERILAAHVLPEQPGGDPLPCKVAVGQILAEAPRVLGKVR